MPWELLIHGSAGEPLGTRDRVVARVAGASGGQPLGPMPLPPPKALAAMSEESRAAFLAPTLWALCDDGDLSFELWCSDEPVVTALHADVRGEGNPLAFLRRLCEPDGWVVYDAAGFFKAVTTGGHPESTVVDLTAPRCRSWEEFCAWRERVVGKVIDPPE